MQGKGIIATLLVIITAICLWQYSMILPTNGIEKDAESYASGLVSDMSGSELLVTQKKNDLKAAYLDSISSEKVFMGYTYHDLKSKQLAYGLDLEGGMSVLMQVNLRDYLELLAGSKSGNRNFQAALDAASESQASAQDNYIALFGAAWAENGDGESLAKIFGNNETMRDNGINRESSNGDVLRELRTMADETVKLTYNRLKQRIDKLGVVQPNVTLDAARDIIAVELPGVSNPERAREFLQASAALEFWHVHRSRDIIPGGNTSIYNALQRLDSQLGTDDTQEKEVLAVNPVYATDELGNIDSTNITRYDTTYASNLAPSGPLLSRLELYQDGGPIIGSAVKNERKTIDNIFEENASAFPNIKFLWDRKSQLFGQDEEAEERYALYAIRTDGRPAPLQGDRITNASVNTDPQTGQVLVNLTMDNQGASIWSGMTAEASQDGQRPIAVVLDDEVASAPNVNVQITGGSSQISGSFTMTEGQDLSSILKIGKLPAKTTIIQESLVGPSLGKENIRSSFIAFIVGFSLLLLFMVFYYGGAGVVSIIALLLNVFFIIGALGSFGTVLTLPGIAGILLTIGMAVDANVIIYERIREELRAGKTKLLAIQDGFKASYSAIIDANVTTFVVALILIYFGIGPIKGFAVVLAIGVAMSVFTAVLVGRMIIEWYMSKNGRDLSFWTGASKNAFATVKKDWLGKRKMAYYISGALITLSLISFIFRGFELGVDFKGGYSYNVAFAEGINVDADALRASLDKVFDSNTTVKEVDGSNTYNIVTSYLVTSVEEGAADQVMAKLHEGVSAIPGIDISLENFRSPATTGTHVIASSKVGPTIADDIARSAKYATVFALLFIFLYIFLRFSKWQYSLGAVAALFHDTIIVLGIFSIFHGILPFSMEIDQAFIAAILTVIGYSINDTVVVFDRVREYMGIYTGKPKNDVINLAVDSTVSRTVITSLTTLFVVLILFIFGGGSIRGFAFALLIGILVGTYSSIFIATPIMSDLTGNIEAKETKRKAFSTVLDS